MSLKFILKTTYIMSTKRNEGYLAPEIELLYVNVERGFASTNVEDPEEGWEI